MKIALVILVLTAPFALAQSTAAPKQPSFEVISIHRSQPATYPGAGSGQSITWAMQPDGYRTNNQTILATLMIAFFPEGMASWTPDRVRGAPAWASTEQYDITARVSADDLPQWQQQGHDLMHQPLFQQMMQSLLADRCNLVYHRISTQVPALVLTVGKNGPKLQPSAPDQSLPAGMRLANGGVVVNLDEGRTLHFYGATMDDLASYMSTFSYPRLIVHNQTALDGKYDLVLHRVGAMVTSPDDDSTSTENAWDLHPLGLEFQHTKIASDTIVIDHIDRPSEN